jgi:hypothetical protein
VSGPTVVAIGFADQIPRPPVYWSLFALRLKVLRRLSLRGDLAWRAG